MRLYRLEIGDQDQWYVDGLVDQAADGPGWTAISGETGPELDPRIFVRGEAVDVTGASLSMRVGSPGNPVDFAFGVFLLPVVARQVGALIERLAPGDVQRIPVEVKGHPGPYEILNVTATVDCIDTDRTVGERWTEADHRSDLAGQWRGVYDLRLDGEVVGRSRIFRVAGWTNALVVTEDIKGALVDAGVSGLRYRPVS